jgi:c-di-GMP phosphodiesterase
MGFIQFVRRLLGLTGGQGGAEVSATGAAALLRTPVGGMVPGTGASPASSTASVEPERPVAALMLRREEMLDRQGRLAGYRFSARASGRGAAWSAQDYADALQAADVRALAERRLAVIALSMDDWQAADFGALTATHTVFQLAPPEQGLGAEGEAHWAHWLATAQRIRASGCGVAVRCAGPTEPGASVLALLTHALVDFAGATVEQVERHIKSLRQSHPAVHLAVENIATWPEQRLALSLGARFAMGDFLSTVDEQDKAERITDSRLVLMEMLNLVRNDGDAMAIAAVAKRDPGVAVHLLAMANSPAYGLAQPLTGIDQAILVLGRETLYRWLAVSIFRSGNEKPLDKTLLEVALARARFLELAALTAGTKQQADELFLVGLLSFVDALLGMPMKAVLAKISLPAVVQDVLLRSEGPYGRYLTLAIAVEKCQADRIERMAGALGFELGALMPHRNAALVWAEDAVR